MQIFFHIYICTIFVGVRQSEVPTLCDEQVVLAGQLYFLQKQGLADGDDIIEKLG